MQSWNLIYPEARQVELRRETVGDPAPDQVLVAMTRSLVSPGTELTCYRGVFDPDTNWAGWVQYPFYPGYSSAGRVVAVGSEVTEFEVGDRVSSAMSHQQFYALPASMVEKIPAEISDEEAVWLSLLKVTQNVVRKCEVRLGDTVAVIGLGPVGQLVAQLARLSGAGQVIGIDPLGYRCEAARRCGATVTLTLEALAAEEPLLKLTGGTLADIVFDATGIADVLAAACKLARDYGRIGLVGDSPTPSQQHLGPGVVSRYLSILGAHGNMTAPGDGPFYPWTEKRVNDISRLLIRQRRLELDSLVTHRISPHEAPELYRQLECRGVESIGVILDWECLD
ncbi:MAG: zinc-binding dehydrogenase [Bacillota bacterium]|nr:zinc-binding dehydrogenase [Bacillota bacterium]